MPAGTERAFRHHLVRLVPPCEPGVQRYSISAADAPSETTRQALALRVDALDVWMQPAGETRAAEQYKNLVAAMATSNVDQETARREAALWSADTRGLPLFALVQACNAFRTGAVGDGKWMPKAGQVVQEAQRRAVALTKERREIQAVLNAEVTVPVKDPVRKAKLLAEAMAFCAEGREMEKVERAGRHNPEALKAAKDRDDELNRCIALGTQDPRPMPWLSDTHRRILGLPDAEPDMVPDLAPRDYDAA